MVFVRICHFGRIGVFELLARWSQVARFASRFTSFLSPKYWTPWFVGSTVRRVVHLSLVAPSEILQPEAYHRWVQLLSSDIVRSLLRLMVIGRFSFLRILCVPMNRFGYWPSAYKFSIWYAFFHIVELSHMVFVAIIHRRIFSLRTRCYAHIYSGPSTFYRFTVLSALQPEPFRLESVSFRFYSGRSAFSVHPTIVVPYVIQTSNDNIIWEILWCKLFPGAF